MSETATPREVFEKLHAGFTSGDWSTLADLYAEDAVVELVFAPAEPRRIEGRQALADRFANLAKEPPFALTGKNVVVRETDDPEVVVAEYEYEVHHNVSGRTFTVPNIQVLRVRDGLIVSTRDYHDHLRFAIGGGRAAELAAQLTAE